MCRAPTLRRALAAAALATVLASCRPAATTGPIAVSLVAGSDAPDPTRAGLVGLDRTGQIVPALALRWAILEDGRDYLFRLDDAPNAPGAAIVARRLRRVLAARRSPGAALPIPVESIQAVTPTVLEIRLTTPQPDLLPFLARAPLDVAATGPFVAEAAVRDRLVLRPRALPSSPIILRRERVGRAVARFRAGAASLVTGGTFADLPVLRAADIDARLIRFDPATGLFGFAVAAGSRFAAPASLHALDLALDRDRILADLAVPGLTAAPGAGGTTGPASFEQLAEARALLASVPSHIPAPLTRKASSAIAIPQPRIIRVAMPAGPGARLLFARVAKDWRAIGIVAVSVAAEAPADLILVDRVAPADGLAALACAVSAECDPRNPAGPAGFIGLASPIRWSLVARDLVQFTPNGLAAHPLDQLRSTR